jgi:hypothetical protein
MRRASGMQYACLDRKAKYRYILPIHCTIVKALNKLYCCLLVNYYHLNHPAVVPADAALADICLQHFAM